MERKSSFAHNMNLLTEILRENQCVVLCACILYIHIYTL